MSKDDTKDQIPLFEVPTAKIETPSPTAAKPAGQSPPRKAPKDKPVKAKQEAPLTAKMKARAEKKPARAAAKVAAKGAPSGQVPEGDVRLTANIREDLHLKLKIAAARRRTTIGELIEELVEEYL
jgi:outer membrane biosynthesis protein TonB